MTARDRLIVALDFPAAAEAHALVAKLGDAVSFYKVGKQLFTAEGPPIVRDLVAAGKRVFLDLKWHDIPNTVAGAVRSAANLGVTMFNVHASGGSAMLRAAVEAAAEFPQKPVVLAVTVLTSMDEAALRATGVNATPLEQVVRLATLAHEAGCNGVVASAREATAIRKKLGKDFVIVTPGVRLASDALNDQSRVLTPAEALAAGADYFIVGRPINAAADPVAAARAILRDAESAFVPQT